MTEIKNPQRYEHYKSLSECIWSRNDQLGEIIYESLRDFYRDIECTEKERLVLDLFNDAYSVVFHVEQCSFPSLYFREYEHIGFQYRKYRDGFNYGGHIRKGVVMSIAYQLIVRIRAYHSSFLEIDSLLRDIEKFSVENLKDFHNNLTKQCDKYVPPLELQIEMYYGNDTCSPVVKDSPREDKNGESGSTSPFIIAKNKQTSVLVVLETMYKAGWIHKVDGSKYRSRDEMIEDVMRILFNQEEIKDIKQKLNSAKNRTYDGKKKYFDELLGYIIDNKSVNKE